MLVLASLPSEKGTWDQVLAQGIPAKKTMAPATVMVIVLPIGAPFFNVAALRVAIPLSALDKIAPWPMASV